MSDGTTAQSSDLPEWWQKNERLREEMELPRYEPPRFDDGVFTHEVIPQLEDEHDCDITFRSVNPRHPCEWEICVDGACVGTTTRQRTDRGNTIYQLSSADCIELVESTRD